MADKRPSLLDSDEELAAFLARMTSVPEPIVASHDFRLAPNISGKLDLQAQPQGTGYGQGAAPPVYNPSAKLNLGPLSLSGGLTIDQMTNPDSGKPYTRTSPNFGAGLKVPLAGGEAEAGFNLTPNQLLMLEAEYRRRLSGGDSQRPRQLRPAARCDGRRPAELGRRRPLVEEVLMPDYLKISELPAASSVAPTDQIELNQAGTSRSATIGLSVGVYQTVIYQTGATATGVTTTPFDDTIPQISEGNEFMTLAITPRSATSRLIIEVVWNGGGSSGSAYQLAVALHQDSTANALAAVTPSYPTGHIACVAFRHIMTSGTTGSTTFRVRAGCNTGQTVFNGYTGGRALGGVMASSIVIQEVAA